MRLEQTADDEGSCVIAFLIIIAALTASCSTVSSRRRRCTGSYVEPVVEDFFRPVQRGAPRRFFPDREKPAFTYPAGGDIDAPKVEEGDKFRPSGTLQLAKR